MEFNFISAAAVFLSSLVGGMGLGGGTVLLLYLTLFTQVPQHMAQAINLLLFFPAAAAALVVQWTNDLVKPGILKVCLPAGIGGGILGSLIGNRMQSETLQKLFAVFLLVIAVKELYGAWQLYKAGKIEKNQSKKNKTA